MLHYIPSIEGIEIYACDHLLVTSPTPHWLSSIKNIYIESDSPCLLQDIRIGSCDSLLSFPKMIINSSCLRELNLDDIPSLTAFPTNGLPTSLQTLHIRNCDSLTFLPPETWSNYTSLVALYLQKSCDTLTSFPLNCFPILQTLYIDKCRSLESIFISETSSFSSSSLQNLFQSLQGTTITTSTDGHPHRTCSVISLQSSKH
ncbi:putative leucine-rich repeat domain, L domain-containing protein [Medicago truncatula]|uniref:Putative leucine-rich repeat domain, L domain-containing protein n=1 Tax=Medicago truncatula TaxID=3880 RepID=A0A396ILC1_MEDTR|nr:putative leucine-rich repeat domain, L domain-containing protein [Medicago truncatula]